MRERRFLLLVGIFLALAILFTISESQQDIIFTDKYNYSINDTVTITLNYTDFNNTRLEVLNTQHRYNFFNPQEIIKFIPREYGLHIIQFFTKSNLLDSLQFNVVNPEPQIQEPVLTKISTDKKEYNLSDTVTIIIETDEDLSQLSLEITNKKTYKFFNLQTKNVKFLPSTPGNYDVVLKKDNDIIAQTSFTVTGELIEGTPEPVIKKPIPKIPEFKILDRKNLSVKLKSLKQALPGKLIVEIEDSPVKKIEFYNLNLTNVSMLKLDKITKSLKVQDKDVVNSYAIDPTQLSFDNATVTVTATGTELWKCKDWDFDQQTCYGSWVKLQDITPGENYTFLLTALDPAFAETNLTIINVQSYPTVGGNWTVRFNTTGIADLTIRAINGTTWDNVNENNDLKFLQLRCGDTVLNYTWINDGVYVPNYYCNVTGYETSKVITSGKHHLQFIFGDDIEYAHNQAGSLINMSIPDAGAPGMGLVVQFIGDNFNYTDTVTVNTSDITVGPIVITDTSGNVVQTNGVMLTTVFFIDEDALDQEISINISGSLVQRPFQIITPTAQSGNFSGQSGTKTIGDGTNGDRTFGGTIILDSLIVPSGVTVNIDVTDPDADSSNGNQGYLPAIIVVDGPVDIQGILDIRGQDGEDALETGGNGAFGGSGGPGGGGGGAGGYDGTLVVTTEDGGHGFTGGAGSTGERAQQTGGDGGAGTGDPGTQNSANEGGYGGLPLYGTATRATSADDLGAAVGGGSGAGTGWPWGSGGGGGDRAGSAAGTGGGQGGGTQNGGNREGTGGGGGGYATAGTAGVDGGGGEGGGGLSYGNSQLLPLVGGSGAGGGGSDDSNPTDDSGGGGAGGAGAVLIFSSTEIKISGSVLATGGSGGTAGEDDGGTEQGGSGGGGSGGAILLQSANTEVTGTLDTSGGSGGSNAGNDGGTGGLGRVRIDGVPDTADFGSTTSGSNFTGPVITNINLTHVAGKATVNSDIDVIVQDSSSSISYSGTADANGDFSISVAFDFKYYYITAIQNTSGDTISVISSASVKTFDNRDLVNPVVKDISITPDPQIINLPVDITVNVTDNQNVSIVRAQITYPNSTFENFTMTDDDNDDVYNVTFVKTSQLGQYNVTFIGIDVDNNINNTEKSNFTIQLDTLSLTTDKQNYVADETVYIFGTGFNPFVTVAVNITDPTEDSVLDTTVISNSTGGINFTWTVPSTPTLGTYFMGANDTTDYSQSVSGSFEVVSAVIETDNPSYEQGETVYISGYSWNPDVNVTVNITDPNAITVYGPVNLTSNSTGNINSTWFIPYNEILGNHLLSGFEPDTPSKNDDYTFTVTARTVVINTQYPWYKTGEQVHISGYGFSPLVNVTIDIYNSTGQTISGYPQDVISNTTGGINDTFTINNLLEGIYTILVNDTVYPNLGATNTFDIVIAEISTDLETYNNGETITIIGKYWDRLVNVTVDVINETSQSESGYPQDIISNITGGFIHQLTARAIGLTASIFNVTAVQPSDPTENATTNYTVVRLAVIDTDKDYYVQKEIVNITGSSYSADNYVSIWVKNTDNGGTALGYPQSILTNSQGNLNHTFNISNYCEGNYIVIGTDETYPTLLNDSKAFVVQPWWNSNWEQRKPIILTNELAQSKDDELIFVNVTGLTGYIDSCVNEIRVVSTVAGNAIDVEIVNGDDSSYCEIIFLGDITASAVNVSNYYVYYNNSQASDPSYSVNADIVYLNADFEIDWDSFVYQDDLYQGTANPGESDGQRTTDSNCVDGSCLHGILATNDDGSGPWSGGFNRTFGVTSSPEVVNITLDYTIRIDELTEAGEYTRLYYRNLLTRADVLGAELQGSGAGGSDGTYESTSGSIVYEPVLSNGNYAFDAGCHLTDTSTAGEDGDCFIDNVVITGVNAYDRNITSTVGSAQNYFTCIDVDYQKPVVKNINTEPNPQIINLPVNITVNVTDNYGMGTVTALITLPNSTQIELPMTDTNNDSLYNLTFLTTPLLGVYNITILANDSVYNSNNTELSNFTISLDNLSITTAKSDYVETETVLIFGTGFNPYVNVTVYIYNTTAQPVSGPQGVISNSTGGINTSWTIPGAQPLGIYTLNATDTTDNSRSANGSFEIVSAIIETDKGSYEQAEIVYITGRVWDLGFEVTINTTDPNGVEVFGPINFTANASGHINTTWTIPFDELLGTHKLMGYEPNNPSKKDDYTFTVTARTVVINTQYPWYKEAEQVNITGYGFSYNNNVTIYIYNATGQTISGYPKDVISNSTGGIYDNFIINNLPQGNYTILANDTIYPHLGSTITFEIVIARISTDKQSYDNGETVTITGLYWDRLVNVTIDVINETSQSESGYPQDVVSDSAGGFIHQLTARAIGLTATLFNVTAQQPSDSGENATTNYTVLRKAILSLDKDYYAQLENVNVTGQFYSPNDYVKVWVKSRDNGGNAIDYPRLLSTDSLGGFNHLFDTNSYCGGNYSVIGTDETYPSNLNASANFTLRNWWDSSWEKRQPIYLTNELSVDREDISIYVNLTGLGGFISNCVNEIRVVSTITGQEVPVSIVGGDDNSYCEIIFVGNVTSDEFNQSNYYAYFNNSVATDPGYSTSEPFVTVISNTSFEVDESGFVYQDELYSSDGNTGQESGQRESDANCASGNCLAVNLNIETPIIVGAFSGGWNRSFTAVDNRVINITYDYTLRLDENLEATEWSILYSRNLSDNSAIEWDRITGNGNGGGDDFSSGTISYATSVTNGTYYFDTGCYLTDVSATDENAECWIDNVLILQLIINSASNITSSSGFSQDYFTCIPFDIEDPEVIINEPVSYYNTTDTTPEINFTIIDNQDTILNYTIFVDGVYYGQNGTVNNNTPQLLNVSTLSEGIRNITVQGMDDFRNAKNSSILIVVDLTGPLTNITQPVNFTNITGTSHDLTVTASDALTAVDTVLFYYRQNDTASWNFACSDNNQPYQCSWNISLLSDGDAYQIRVYANDTLGNIGANYTVYNITLDRTGPIVTITDPVNFTNITSNLYTIQTTASDSLSEVDIVRFYYREDDVSSWTFLGKDSSVPYRWTWNLTLLNDGDSYQVRAYGNDTLGNIGYNFTVYNITIDRKAPDISNINITPDPQKVGLFVNITVNISDIITSVDYVEARIILPNTTQINLEMRDDNFDSIYNVTFINTLLIGVYNLTIFVNDTLSNSNTSNLVNFTIIYDDLYLATDDDKYVVAETVYIIGEGFNAYTNVTINIYNSTGQSMNSFPRDILSNRTGGLNDSWTIPGTQPLGIYTINATDITDSSRSIETTFEIVAAIIDTLQLIYQQADMINITGEFWDPNEDVTINITDSNGIEVYGPINVTSNASGFLTANWSSNYNSTVGEYTLRAYQPSNPNKFDTHFFNITFRTVYLLTDYPWYKEAETVYITGYGFSPLVNVTIDIYNETGQSISGYPINVSSNSTGSINNSFVVNNLIGGIYTINATDTLYQNLNNFTTFDIVFSTITTDKSAYINGETVYIIGNYWTKSVNITIDIINETGQSITGYPKNVSSLSDGSISDSLTAEAIGLGSTQYNITAYNPNKPEENTTANYTVARVALLIIDKIEYDKNEEINITGEFYSQNGPVEIIIRYLNNSGFTYYYPQTVYSNVIGDIQHIFNTSYLCEGEYIIEASDLTFSSLHANASFNVSYYNDNSSLETSDNSSASGIYNVFGGSTSDTYTSNDVWQHLGSINYDSNFTAYLNYTFNISELNADPYRISNLSFSVEYCHSGGEGSPQCNQNDPHEGNATGPQYIYLFNYSNNQWFNYTNLPVNDTSDNEFVYDFNIDTSIPDFVQDDIIYVRFTVSFNQSGVLDDHLLIDYFTMNITFESEVERACTPLTTKFLNVQNYDDSLVIIENTKVDVFNLSNANIDTGNGSYFRYLPFDELKVKVITPFASDNLTYEIFDLNFSGSVNITSQINENYSYSLPNLITNITPLIAINDSQIMFSKVQLKIPKRGQEINTILHCINYNYSNAECLQFELNDTNHFEYNETNDYILFNVTYFDAFGGGPGDTLPNLTEIRIYNVTGQGDTHSGGTLIHSGLNTTFNLTGNNAYRVEFAITNEGRRWSIKAGDYAYHSGLNETWFINTTNDIWYIDSRNNTNYTGGTFSNGKVEWDLSLEGTYDAGGSGAFYYVVNITTNKTEWYPVHFIVNDTSKESGSTDDSTYRIFDIIKPYIVLNQPYQEDNLSVGSITFNWTAVDNSDFNLSCDLFINSVINQSGITTQNNIETTTSVTISTSARYNWSINCTDYDGNFNISETRNFTVIAGPFDITINISSDNASIELNWSAAQFADSYNIFISTNYSSGFSSMPNITGITDLNWTDINGFDSSRRYYKIATVKGDTVALSTKTVGKHTNLLIPTWNLISIPFNITEWLLYDGADGRDIFTQQGDCITTLWRYNSTNQSWGERTDYSGGIWTPGSGSENFLSLEDGRGYFAEISSSCNITFYGDVPVDNRSYSLDLLWNVMGHYSSKDPLLQDESIMKPIAVIPENSVEVILRYNTQINKFEVTVHYPGIGWWPSFNNQDFIYLNPMRGYYFDNSQIATWTHDPKVG